MIGEIGYPAIIRPSFTLGGVGGGIARDAAEFESAMARALDASPSHSALVEESVLGWKEFEMEVVRDRRDNCIIVCSIENIDPMGIHTGDSITVAPALTLTDKEYQRMRDASIAVLREIGVDTGGSNVQFAIHPDNGRMVVIEMNPRVSRSSALASKATGFPIAKVAAKLAIGYTLDELRNEITAGLTPASFEPAIDYIVTKAPRFAFEKFPRADARLTTQMKSVGEAMSLGRTFQESLQKALRSLEIGIDGLCGRVDLSEPDARSRVGEELRTAGAERLLYMADALRLGMDEQEVYELSRIDPWFIGQIADLVREEEGVRKEGWDALSDDRLLRLKRKGFADSRLAHLLGVSERQVTERRRAAGIGPVFKRVDSCAAEFPTSTAYMYSSYEEECEAEPSDRAKIMIPGRGTQPDRAGHRVRLLLRARGAGAARSRLRDDHGELQPRDRLHRLRHLRQAVFRTPDGRGRHGDSRAREARGRDRPVRRPDAASDHAGPGSRRRPDYRDAPGRHRPGRGSRALQAPAGGTGPKAAGRTAPPARLMKP